MVKERVNIKDTMRKPSMDFRKRTKHPTILKRKTNMVKVRGSVHNVLVSVNSSKYQGKIYQSLYNQESLDVKAAIDVLAKYKIENIQ